MIDRLLASLKDIRNDIVGGRLNEVIARFGDLVLVGCVALMVGMMIIPLPELLLDIFLTLNITIAVTILMVSIYISNGSQIASFPTLLLITTLYRLSLDISATRLILLHGDAGEVIRAFGMFVVQGNFVVGAVIFLIITLVQFIVITKGSERVAEVSARFTLDAMPGKQMSIDADLRAGSIDLKEAKKRRDGLSRESQFYGAMDGAMKFVKGDAIASLIITAINILGGLIIGIAMRGMEPMKAVQTYSILTIGNGLVSQIPALLISISAGMVVTRVGSEVAGSNLGREVTSQLTSQPKAISVSAVILLVMALIPGLPKVPFFLLAAITGAVAIGLSRTPGKPAKQRAATNRDAETPVSELREPEITLTVPVVVELSPELTDAVEPESPSGERFQRMLLEVRNSLYYETGVLFPPIRVSGNRPIGAERFSIWLQEVPLVEGVIPAGKLLVNDRAANLALFQIQGEAAVNPATGKSASWIDPQDGPRARLAGMQVWDTTDVVALHLTAFLKRYAREFIGVQEVQWMLNTIKQYYPNLVEEVVPKPVSLQMLAALLQRLAEEGVSVRDVRAILQGLSEYASVERDLANLTERIRTVLKRQICRQLTQGRSTLYVYQLSPEIEDLFRDSIRESESGPYLAMPPESIERLLKVAHERFGKLPESAQSPVLLVSGEIRRYVKKLFEYAIPGIAAISFEELVTELNVQPMGTLALASDAASEAMAA
jgi:type III secretion protein V